MLSQTPNLRSELVEHRINGYSGRVLRPSLRLSWLRRCQWLLRSMGTNQSLKPQTSRVLAEKQLLELADFVAELWRRPFRGNSVHRARDLLMRSDTRVKVPLGSI